MARVGAYCIIIGVNRMNWLGITSTLVGYGGTIVLSWVGTINPPLLGLAYFVKVNDSWKTLSIV